VRSDVIPTPKGWIAEAWIDSEGNETKSSVPGNVGVFAICVNSNYATDAEQRITLLKEVAHGYASHVPSGHASLFVFPAGFFSFPPNFSDWDDESDKTVVENEAFPLQNRLEDALSHYPPNAWVAVGVDHYQGFVQQVWLCSFGQDKKITVRKITRHSGDVNDHKVSIGPLIGTFFVCAEFYEDHYLSNSCGRLADCRLLVDLAHRHVRGTIDGDPSPRMSHLSHIIEFVPHGTAVLTHHHSGRRTSGRARNDCRSDWIFFKGGKRLDPRQVRPIP
jgi:hypothetical protein